MPNFDFFLLPFKRHMSLLFEELDKLEASQSEVDANVDQDEI
jgi:hypothetical protein